jgi:hypothetical protein
MSAKNHNPIFVEYYPHTHSDCYKICLPWTNYRSHVLVLCEVSEGYLKACVLAMRELDKHLRQALTEPLSPAPKEGVFTSDFQSDLEKDIQRERTLRWPFAY